MRTRIEVIDPMCIDEEIIAEAGRVIRDGGLCAFPTETVYGLGADALFAEASQKIYAAKGRPSDNPLIVHIASMDDLTVIARTVPERAMELARAFWPGPLTLIFAKTERVPDTTSGGLSTVAVRMPSHPVARALIQASGGFIAAPSANVSGRPSPTCAAHVIEDMDGRIDMILDGGPCGVGLESTILDMTEDIPMILRPGYISRAMIEEVIGPVETDPGISAPQEGIAPKAPGMRYRHYAPQAPLTIVRGKKDHVRDALERILKEKTGESIAILCAAGHADEYRRMLADAVVIPVGVSDEEDDVARALYQALRSCDESGVTRIYAEGFDGERLGEAIMNRLLRAAGFRVIEV